MTDPCSTLTTGQPIIERRRHLTARDAENPWGLTPRQLEVARAIVKHHHQKGVARALNITVNSSTEVTKAIFKRVGIHHVVGMAVTFDRWDRGQS